MELILWSTIIYLTVVPGNQGLPLTSLLPDDHSAPHEGTTVPLAVREEKCTHFGHSEVPESNVPEISKQNEHALCEWTYSLDRVMDNTRYPPVIWQAECKECPACEHVSLSFFVFHSFLLVKTY